jgi:hypothetical protein
MQQGTLIEVVFVIVFFFIVILWCGYSRKAGPPSVSVSRKERLEDKSRGLGFTGPLPLGFSAVQEHDDPETSTERAIKRDPHKDL